jgi:HTH-type transcriptional regulator / antitoxin HipB
MLSKVKSTKTEKKNEAIRNAKNHDEILDIQYGKKGTAKRNKYEQGYEAFKLGVLIQVMREKKHLTQEQLATKCGTTKSYISRIENNAGDIRISTLMRIIRVGLGGQLQLSIRV